MVGSLSFVVIAYVGTAISFQAFRRSTQITDVSVSSAPFGLSAIKECLGGHGE